MVETPTVDIVMATYNGGRYVAEQVASIEAQTFPGWRLLVSDDCSGDDTVAIIELMADDDPRIGIVSKGVRHGGAAQNFMSLLPRVEAPYVMFADQDDVWLPQKVERSLAEMQKLESAHGKNTPLLVFADMRVVDDDLKEVATSFMRLGNYDPTRVSFPQLLAQNVAAGCTIVANRPLIDFAKSTTVNDGRLVMHDWWLMLLASAFGYIAYIDEQLSLYRQHGDNEVGANAYSPLDRARHQRFMEEQFRESLTQAEFFLETYGCEMNDADRKSAEEFVAVSRAKTFLEGAAHLIRSRSLKKGARKIGQLAMVARVSAANRASGEAS